MSNLNDDLQYLLSKRIEDAENASDDKQLADAVADIFKLGEVFEKLEKVRLSEAESNSKEKTEAERLSLDKEKVEIEKEKVAADNDRINLEREKLEHQRKIDEEKIKLEREKLQAEIDEMVRKYESEKSRLEWEKEEKEKEREAARERLEAEYKIRKEELDNEFKKNLVDNVCKLGIAAVGFVAIGGILDLEKTGAVTSKALQTAMSLWSRRI